MLGGGIRGLHDGRLGAVHLLRSQRGAAVLALIVALALVIPVLVGAAAVPAVAVSLVLVVILPGTAAVVALIAMLAPALGTTALIS